MTSTTGSTKSYGRLSAQQRGLIDTKQIEGIHTPSEWMAMLGEIAAFDTAGDRSRSRAGWGCGLSAVFTFIVLIVFTPLAPIPFLVMIVFAVLFFRLKKRDVPNGLRDSVLPLLALLREDMEPDAELRLRIDLREPLRKENGQGSRDLPGSGLPRITQTMYHNAWMSGMCTLADGTKLEWSLEDRIRERKVTKRGRSGKIKTKHKYKVQRLIDMRVGMRRDGYAWHDDAADASEEKRLKVAAKEGAKRTTVKLRRAAAETGTYAPRVDSHLFIDTLAGAYRRATLVKEEK